MHVLLLFAGLSTIEAYNAKTDEWFHVLPMSTRRSSVGVGVVNGEYCSQFSFIFKNKPEGVQNNRNISVIDQQLMLFFTDSKI